MRNLTVTLLLLTCCLAPLQAQAQDSPWRHRLSVQGGGTTLLGTVEQEVDGRPIRTVKPRTQGDSPRDLLAAVDVRASYSALHGHWSALTLQLGWTNWQSQYMKDAGHRRSNYFSVGLSPELRIPLGKCVRCPAGFLAPKGGFALSLRDQRALRAAAYEHGRAGVGGFWGVRAGMDIPFHPRFGLKVETGVEQSFLRHHVHYEGAGEELQTFKISRPITLVGMWWTP
jgi:hypothetical protein